MLLRLLANGPVLTLIGFSLFSLFDTINKLVLRSVDIAAFTIVQGAFVASIVLAVTAARGKLANLRPKNPRLIALYALLYIVAQVAYCYPLSRAPMAELFVLFLTIPLVGAVLSVLVLRETIKPLQAAALVCGFAATLVVTRVWEPADGGKGMALFTLAAIAVHVIASAVRNVFIRKSLSGEHTECLLFTSTLICSLALLLYSPSSLTQLTVETTGSIALTSAVFAAGAFCFIRGFQIGPVAVAGAMQYVQIAWAAFYGWLVFAEVPAPATYIGMSLIVLSGYLLYRAR